MGEQLVVKMVGQTTVLEGMTTKQQKATEGRTQGVRPFFRPRVEMGGPVCYNRRKRMFEQEVL